MATQNIALPSHPAVGGTPLGTLMDAIDDAAYESEKALAILRLMADSDQLTSDLRGPLWAAAEILHRVFADLSKERDSAAVEISFQPTRSDRVILFPIKPALRRD